MPKHRPEPNPVLQRMVDNVDSSLVQAQRKQLADLLAEFSDAFSMDENDLGWTNVVTHAIDTGDSKPARQPLRRHPPAHDDAIQKHVADMLEQPASQGPLGVECSLGEKERWFAQTLHRLSLSRRS